MEGGKLDISQAKAILSRILDTKRENDPPAVRIKKSRSFELDRKAEVMINKDQTFESKYELLEELGKGMFGTVKKCQCTDTGVEYAAKVVRKTTKNKEEVVREVSTMNLLQHKSIAQIHDAFESKRQMVIVMELIRGKELFEKVCQEDTLLTEKQCVYYLRQILSGVEYMHKKKIVHLDLKPENILCIDSPQGYDEIKLIDFGLARDLSSTKQLSCICGTPEFVAPEVINFDPISVQSDMWSLGVITYVLLSGISPFLGDDDGETLQNVTFGEFDFEDEDGAFEHVSEIAKEFISDLLCLNPRDRLSVGDCLEHSWLNTQTNEEELDTTNLKKFIARRRWLRTIHAIKAVGRFNQVANSLGGKGKKGGDSLAKTMLAALNAANKENSIDKEDETKVEEIISQSADVDSKSNQSESAPETVIESNGFHKDKPAQSEIVTNGNTESTFGDDDEMSDMLKKRAERRRRKRFEDEEEDYDVFANVSNSVTEEVTQATVESPKVTETSVEECEKNTTIEPSEDTQESVEDMPESLQAAEEDVATTPPDTVEPINVTLESENVFTTEEDVTETKYDVNNNEISDEPAGVIVENIIENDDKMLNNEQKSVEDLVEKDISVESVKNVSVDEKVEHSVVDDYVEKVFTKSEINDKVEVSPSPEIIDNKEEALKIDSFKNSDDVKFASENVEDEIVEKLSTENKKSEEKPEFEKRAEKEPKTKSEVIKKVKESSSVKTEEKESTLPSRRERRRESSTTTSSEKKESVISPRREKAKSPEPQEVKESSKSSKSKKTKEAKVEDSPKPTNIRESSEPLKSEKRESRRSREKSPEIEKPKPKVSSPEPAKKVEKTPPKTSSKPPKDSPKKSKEPEAEKSKDGKVTSPKSSRKIGSKISGLLNKVSSPKSQRKTITSPAAKDKKHLSPKSSRKLASKFEAQPTDPDTKQIKSPPPTSKKPIKSPPPAVKDKPKKNALKTPEKLTSTSSEVSATPERSSKAAPPPTSPKRSTPPAVQDKPKSSKPEETPSAKKQPPSASTKPKKTPEPTEPKDVTDSSRPKPQSSITKPEEDTSSPKSPDRQDRLRNRVGSLGNNAKTNMPVSGKDKKGLFMAWETRMSTPEQSRRTYSTASPLTNRNLIAARKVSLNKQASQERSFDSDGSSIEDRTSSPVGRFSRNSSVRASLNESNLSTTRKRLVTKPHSIANNGSVKNKMAIFAKFQKQ